VFGQQVFPLGWVYLLYSYFTANPPSFSQVAPSSGKAALLQPIPPRRNKHQSERRLHAVLSTRRTGPTSSGKSTPRRRRKKNSASRETNPTMPRRKHSHSRKNHLKTVRCSCRFSLPPTPHHTTWHHSHDPEILVTKTRNILFVFLQQERVWGARKNLVLPDNTAYQAPPTRSRNLSEFSSLIL